MVVPVTIVLVYQTNNSGGHWWLSKEDWDALEKAGWNVHWTQDKAFGKDAHKTPSCYSDDPDELLRKVEPKGPVYLGAWATSCAKRVESVDAGIAEFERVANQCAADEGCNCCGSPHSFSYVAENGERHYSTVEVTETRMVWS